MLNILDFGADPNGVNDSGAALNAAVAATSANGGQILCPAGNYRMAQMFSNLVNGIPRDNIMLIGEGAGNCWYNGTPSNGATRFLWDGPPGYTMFTFQATADVFPVHRGGMRDIHDDCNNGLAACGISVITMSFGEFRNLNITNAGSISVSLGVLGNLPAYSGAYNTSECSFENISIYTASTNAYGFNLDGANQPTANNQDANVCYNIFRNLYIQAGTLPAIRLYDADHNLFFNTRIFSSSYGVILSKGSNGANGGNTFYFLSSQNGGVQQGQAGNNYLFGYDRLNGQPAFTLGNAKSIHITEIQSGSGQHVDPF